MKYFSLFLQSSTSSENIAKVISFVGEDTSGSFGIMAGHQRFMTCLKFGLSWARLQDGTTKYLAVPGGVLYFDNPTLTITTRHYLISNDYHDIATALEQKNYKEEQDINSIKNILHNLDTDLLKNMKLMK